MDDICIRGRAAILTPVPGKLILLTGNSMLINYSRLTRYVPNNVYEMDPRTGLVYKSDGGAIVGYDNGWYAWAPDGVSRESVMPYMAQLGVNAGHAENITLLNVSQGGTDCVDWQPGGPFWNRMRDAVQNLGVVPDLHIHYLGCWDAVKGYSYEGVLGITNWFIIEQQNLMPNTRLKIGKRTFINGVSDAARDTVWAGMYQAIVNQNRPNVSCGPDDDIDLLNVADSVHFIDNSRYYVCQQWVSHLDVL